MSVHVANPGDTFVHADGTLTAGTSSGPITVRLSPGTILPGDRAAVEVALGRLADGGYPVAVSLCYGASTSGAIPAAERSGGRSVDDWIGPAPIGAARTGAGRHSAGRDASRRSETAGVAARD
ncbi:MAG: hypothetical protein ACYCTE_10360 [Acidimicrobiales bacterium]